MKVRQHSHNLQAELPYEHIPLESKRSMRLVKISPADSWAPLKCEIIQVDTLDNAPAYEAILYTWGDYRIRHPLVCGPEGQILQVSESCISVLRRIRLSDVPRVVWVDAICINQDDDLERNTQVAMMGQIYHQAIRVIIDLGEESVHSNDAIDYIADCSETDCMNSNMVSRLGMLSRASTSDHGSTASGCFKKRTCLRRQLLSVARDGLYG